MITTTNNNLCCICGMPGAVGISDNVQYLGQYWRTLWYCFRHMHHAYTVTTGTTSLKLTVESDNTANRLLEANK